MSAQARAAPSGRLGVKMFVASDAFAFAGLLFAYAVLRAGASGWGVGEPALGVGLGAALTAILLTSSVTLALALRAGGSGRALLCLATALLGLLFCAGQALEWIGLAKSGLRFGGSQRAGLFYVLTGYHGLHVLAGSVLLVGLAARRPSRPALEAAAVYWHFVDLVWLFLFASLYLVG